MKNPCKILNSTRPDKIASSLSTSISPSDLATRARKVVRSEGLRTLPVTEGGNLHGIVQARDLLKITSVHSNIKVSGLMSPPPLKATPEWNCTDIAQKAIERNIPAIPLVKSQMNKAFLGVVRLENILNEIADACGKNPKVREIMTQEVITTHPEEQMSKVWSKMTESNISGIPVLKEEKPVGMITRLDILRSGKARLAIESKKGRTPPKIKTIMKTPVIKIDSEASIQKAAGIMKEKEIGRLPITENEKLIGIVDREDVIRPYLR